jgi:hypothetical protein
MRMLTTKVIEFETIPQENRFGELIGMRIRVELGNDSNLIITGTSTGANEGKNYMGILTLRTANSGAMPGSQEGGDECWVNGVWVTPCPPSTD